MLSALTRTLPQLWSGWIKYIASVELNLFFQDAYIYYSFLPYTIPYTIETLTLLTS